MIEKDFAIQLWDSMLTHRYRLQRSITKRSDASFLFVGLRPSEQLIDKRLLTASARLRYGVVMNLYGTVSDGGLTADHPDMIVDRSDALNDALLRITAMHVRGCILAWGDDFDVSSSELTHRAGWSLDGFGA